MVTAPGSGAEIIPFLKTWVNLPMAIGFTVLYSAVSCGTLLGSLQPAVRLALSVQLFPRRSHLPKTLFLLPPAAVQPPVQRGPVLHLHHPLHCLLRLLRCHHVPHARRPAPHW